MNSTDVDLSELSDQISVRKHKRERLLQKGQQPYPVQVPRTDSIAAVREKFADQLEAGEHSGVSVSISGRVMHLRNTGKLCFAALQDGDGTRIQVMLSLGEVGDERFNDFKADVDLGDIISVTGEVISSKRGELSIFASAWQMTAKSIRPLPTLHKDLSEESRVRHRYVDLIMRPAARDMVRLRSNVVHSLRELLHSQDYIEIETPMLHTLAGGAAARPFVTHMNAYDIELYLRIAPELFLKRALVGGLERVFEINRNFRNEGADSTHSPEFAMLEAYQAYGDYNTMATLTKNLVQQSAEAALGSTEVQLADGSTYELGGDWDELTMYGSLSEKLGEEITPQTSREYLSGLAEKFEIKAPDWATHGTLIEELWEFHVGDHLSAPTFVRDFPVETSPLTREHRETAGVVEKWDLYVRGFELATAYSELVDPVIQRQRFVEQARQAAAGDDEAMSLDEEYLQAMEHALPPSGGMGMGIDRLLMAMTGLGIRETILFPLVKPLER